MDCSNTYDPNDLTRDGVINLNDFRLFSAAWLSHSPSEPNGEPNDFVNWNPVCNLDNTGDSEYVIDLADFDIFCAGWLWEACWHSDYVEYGMMMGMGGESMMMAMPMTESLYSSQSLQAESIQPVYEPTPEEEAASITQILDFLDKVLEEDNPDNEKEILEIIAVLEEWLAEIKL